MKSFLSCVLAVFAFLVMSSYADRKSCKLKFELGIVLDSSNSLSNDDFKNAKEFVVQFLSSFDIGPDKVRVALVMYGNDVDRDSAIGLADYNNKDSLLNAVRDLNRILGNTSTWLAIDYMHQELMKDSVVRSGVPRDIVVITDGNSQIQSKTNKSALEARNDGVNVFAVGVGRKVDETELVGIAGDNSRVFSVDGYKSLNTIISSLAAKACKGPPPPIAKTLLPTGRLITLKPDKKPCKCNENKRKQA